MKKNLLPRRSSAPSSVKNTQNNYFRPAYKKSAISSGVGKTHSGDVFAAGDRVRHLTFGAGTVLSVREMGADLLYEIAFDTVGTKN